MFIFTSNAAKNIGVAPTKAGLPAIAIAAPMFAIRLYV
jgi:hypothetical protein